MRFYIAFFAAPLALACTLDGTSTGASSNVASSSTSGGTASTTWTDTEMQNLVATKCATAGCHDGTRSPDYAGISEADMKANTAALREVQSGKMPERSSLTPAEKALFLAFYE